MCSSITLTALFYYLLRHPRCYAKLQSEVDMQLPPKEPGHGFHIVSLASANALPYLHACVQEAFRMHPANAFNGERIVPASGATICGNLIPAGTVVGVNAWVVQRDRGVFGVDADEYRPERWLGPSEQVKQMEMTMFQFGAGDHICLGKNISLEEIYKLVPSLMQNFEVGLAVWGVFWFRDGGLICLLALADDAGKSGQGVDPHHWRSSKDAWSQYSYSKEIR